jgi:hypothetical protein
MSATHGGKGSKPRPISDQQKFADNWDLIFGKKEPEPILEPIVKETDDSKL